MSDKLSPRKRFPTLWARIALKMLPIAEDENMSATTTKKMEEVGERGCYVYIT